MTAAEFIEPTPLRRIIVELCVGLLEVITEGDAGDRQVTGVLMHDPVTPLPVLQGEIVLAVGVASEDALTAVLGECEGAPAAVVISERFVPSEALLAEIEKRRIALLALAANVTWLQLSTSLLFAFSAQRSGRDLSLGLSDEPLGDLFAITNAISAALEAPVTIEDTNSRVLAFSARQDETDSQRQETVLSSRVPESYTTRLHERGLFQRVYRSSVPVFIDSEELEFGTSRTAIVVRIGSEVLGAIWLASDNRLTPEQEQYLAESSKIVALRILRHRARARRAQEIRSELLERVFARDPAAEDLANRLGITSKENRVFAFQVARSYEPSAAADRRADCERLAELIDNHVQATHQNLVSARIDEIVYAVVPDEISGRSFDSLAFAEELTHLLRPFPIRVGLGRPVGKISDLPVSRRDAERVLGVLRRPGSPSVQAIENVHLAALLLDAVRGSEADGIPSFPPLARLRAYDGGNENNLVRTLQVWLEEQGDINRTAARLHLHPNTCRYRLKRISEVSGADLSVHEQRLMLMLHLWLEWPPGGGADGSRGEDPAL